MSKIEDGGPAFPKPLDPYPNMQAAERGWHGMSLRDWFAGMSLCGMSARDSFDPGQATPQQRARLAYIEADAMLAARKEGQS